MNRSLNEHLCPLTVTILSGYNVAEILLRVLKLHKIPNKTKMNTLEMFSYKKNIMENNASLSRSKCSIFL